MQTGEGFRIERRAFLQAVAILLGLMLAAGLLTKLAPAGAFDRVIKDGRETVIPGSYHEIARPHYPAWRWLTAPVEVLWGSDAAMVITIIIFLTMIGGAFAVLQRGGILQSVVAGIVKRFGGRKYALLLAVSFFFMAAGALFGIFEEVVPLAPIMVALSWSLGWDSLVGLGMSVMAVNLGFSAAITNPFTIGVAQRIAGLPLFSGSLFRIPVFLTVYATFAVFLVRYAKRIEKAPEQSPVFNEDKGARERFSPETDESVGERPGFRAAVAWFCGAVGLTLLMLAMTPFIPALADVAFPLVGLLFVIGGAGAGRLSGMPWRGVWRAFGGGAKDVAPAILLILMAASVKHIVSTGGIMDTLLFKASGLLTDAGPFGAAVFVYAAALAMEFFISSGSAKAFLVIPVLMPLAELLGVTRQVTVQAYCFGDGFANLIYPTSPTLLICLGLTVVSYPKWLRWSLKFWLYLIPVTLALLAVGVAVRLGPF